MSFFMHGLKEKGWEPAVNFWFDNQLLVGVPGKGAYIFYDRKQLSSSDKYKDVQESIDNNPDFVAAFQRRTDELFGAIFFKCLNIELENLGLLSDIELHALYQDLMKTIMVGPIITVQLWGIEACLDESYRIATFLRKRLQELGKSKECELYKGLLSINTGETVAFTEQKNFYQVADKLYAHTEIREVFMNSDVDTVSQELKKYPQENKYFEQHTKKYEWVNTEYVSGGWSREQWIALFQKTIQDTTASPQQKYKELLDGFTELNEARKKAIQELNPSADVLHALDGLAELIAQRDWSKGYLTRILLSVNKVLDEVAKRLSSDRLTLLDYTYFELGEAICTRRALAKEELESRKNDGWMFIIKQGVFELITGRQKIQEAILREGVNEPFENLVNITEFKGTIASLGKITAKARVLEDASRINELEEGEILVTYMTTIEFIPAFRKAKGVITDEGGMSCHAAIISREFKLPCVVGTKVATRVIQTGDLIELDASSGTIKILEK